MISKRLKELRQDRDLLQKDIATFLNITTSAYGFYEQGKRVPDSDTLSKLADFFEVSVDYILGREPSSTKSHNNITELSIPKEYTDKYKVTSRDKKQYLEEMKKANEAFFMNDELNDDSKKEMLDLMSELFWEAKTMNKRKK